MTGDTVPLPNFFLAGAPKAGTTSLYYYLDQHPQIYMSPLKEPHYFSAEFRVANFNEEMRRLAAAKQASLRKFLDGPMNAKHFGGPVEHWEDYRRLFRGVANETVIGEASVSYLWSPSAAANIAACVPHARIAAMLRNPAERAFSQYLNLRATQTVRFSFREYAGASMAADQGLIGPLHPFLDLGNYARQIRRYWQHFPRNQVRVYFYEDYQANPVGLIRDLFQFLGVDESFAPDTSQRYLTRRFPKYPRVNRALQRCGLWDLARKAVPRGVRKAGARMLFRPSGLALEPEDRKLLVDYYHEEIVALAELTGRDLSGWLRA